MEPVILDAYTSSTTSDQPKKVFFIGDSIQWNVVHEAGAPELIGQPYQLHFIMQRYRQPLIASEADTRPADFELIVPLQRTILYERADLWEATVEWFDWPSIPDLGPSLDFGPNWGRRRLVEHIAYERLDLLFSPGFWKFTAILESRADAAYGEFDVLAGWHYQILGYRGPI
jgi:hypothetical protein